MLIRALKAFVSIFFLVFSLVGNVAYGNSQDLVSVFCLELVHSSAASEPFWQSDHNWQAFGERLERREPSIPMESLDEGGKVALGACKQNYRRHFVRGEFILGGKETLSQRVLKPSEADTFFSGEKAKAQRFRIYSQLWSSFLSGLRSELSL